MSLVVVLSEPPTLSFHNDIAAGDIVIAGESFEDSGLGDFAGFYDWLRSASSGKIIGVRTWLLDNPGLGRVQSLVATCSAIVMRDKELRCFFSAERNFDDSQSDDQDFGVHRISISINGVVALIYDVEALSEKELQDIRELPRFIK